MRATRSRGAKISNIKAWEGAIAVVEPDDDGRYGSHRYLTYVPKSGVVTARWVCHFLLSPEGLYEVGEESPGSADRNRTTSAKGLEQIQLPVPSYSFQQAFDAACEMVAAIEAEQQRSAAQFDALLPSVLDKAFKGEL
jgi:type I restriction enzyme S subunit